MNKFFYERNDYLLNHPVNKTFEEVLWMPKDEFRVWCIELRKTVVYAWDTLGLPPRVGYNKSEIIEQFDKMIGFRVDEFEQTDEFTNTVDVIRNTTNLGNATNQWFQSMMKTRINYSKKDDGKSIYDYFAQEKLLDTFVTYATRHFKRDSFFHYSIPARVRDTSDPILCSETGPEWIRKFESKLRWYHTKDYWLAPRDIEHEYTGYDEKLKSVRPLYLNRKEIEELGDTIPAKCKTNVDWDRSETYQIRVYKYGQKLFPVGLKAFRVSFCQYAVQFPPLTATYLYRKFTEDFKDEKEIIVWDPSCGWGGRIVGAMAVNDRKILYLGNDPNTDHTTPNGRTKYHEVADFFNQNTSKATNLWGDDANRYKIWQLGSEVMQFDPEFQKYKGKVSMVFTSPPYFAKEAYSEDPTQSYKKFTAYESWRDGFLRETLKTAVEWLRPGGYICWNIADAKFGKDMLPLEGDSCKFLEEFGMKPVTKLKMALMPMPGANRVEEGKATAKNSCRVNGLILKHEPIFVYRRQG